jgi:pimeloyl-ACP methyl ester carboxylesterase
MLTLFQILFYLAVVLGALAAVGFAFGRFFRVDRTPDSVAFCVTEDGWRLALPRHEPREPLPDAPPVLLLPGFGMSSGIFDVLEEVSLCRYLADLGYDVWCLDPRGRGSSERPRLWGRRRYTWSFDDYVDFDLPAALEAVCRRTGAPQVQLVGFGLGALTALGLREGQQRVRSLVALGCAASFKRLEGLLPPWKRLLTALLWNEQVLRVVAPLLGRLTPPPFDELQNLDNVDGPVYRRALINAVFRPSRRELRLYARWLRQDVFEGADQGRDHRQQLAQVACPTLLISGPRDPLVPPGMLDQTLAALEQSSPRAAVLASRVRGLSANYGHLDLLLGRNVRRDIHPWISAWLDHHAGVELPPDRPQPPGQWEGTELTN